MSKFVSKHQIDRIREVRRQLEARGYSFQVRPGKHVKGVAIVRFEQGLREVKAIKEGKIKGGSLKSLFDGK